MAAITIYSDFGAQKIKSDTVYLSAALLGMKCHLKTLVGEEMGERLDPSQKGKGKMSQVFVTFGKNS